MIAVNAFCRLPVFCSDNIRSSRVESDRGGRTAVALTQHGCPTMWMYLQQAGRWPSKQIDIL